MLGETELLTGNLEAARAHLADAARLSREVGAAGGESLARLRLGEALMHLGDRAGAQAQLDEALELAHVSPLAPHLLFLVHAARLGLARDGAEALALLDGAEAVLDPRWVCVFCPSVYHLAAAAACGRAGDPERGRPYLHRGEEAARRLGGPWPAAVAEARAALLAAEGDERGAADALRRAAEGYAAAGQLLNEQRARDALQRLGAAA